MVEAVVDVNIEDEAAGARRVELAAESKARREADKHALAQQNAELHARNANVEQRTDDNIEDEEAGKRRIELAAQSKARRETEARALAQRNAEMRQRIERRESAGPATDMDISDEPAGKRRLELAAASKARREAEARALAKRNAEMRAARQKARQTARSDDDINDEAAGKRRLELAAESKAQRENAAIMLAQRNLEMRERLDNVKARTYHKKGARPASSSPPRLSFEEAEKLREAREAENDAAELRLLRAMLDRSTVAEKKEGGWNTSPHRSVPYALRGIRPMHTMEPWAKGVINKCKEEELRAGGSSYATAGLSRLDDGSRDDTVLLRRRRAIEDMEASSLHGRPMWDSSPWHYTPSALNGLKPVTKEPWARDIELYIAAGE